MHWGVAVPKGLEMEPLDKNGYLITAKVSIRETWEAMEGLIKAGLVKAIGVANFTTSMLVDLMTYAKIPPAINQVELHPYLQQKELIEFCVYNSIAVTAYSPLGSPGNYKPKGFPVIAEDKIIQDIADTYKKTPIQIIIGWGIQRGTILIPKSVTPERIKENLEVFDFELSEQDMQAIAKLDRGLRFVNPYTWWKIPYFD